jgi:photosynthetic reaction center M subunit
MGFEYQNLFTSVQAIGPSHPGVPLARDGSERTRETWHVHLLGRIGDA